MRERSENVIDDRRDFGQRFVAVEAWAVPESTRYPAGIKYSMHYGTVDGDTIVRYDNFPDHPAVHRHHKHTSDGEVVDVEYEGFWPLLERFKNEVRSHGHEW